MFSCGPVPVGSRAVGRLPADSEPIAAATGLGVSRRGHRHPRRRLSVASRAFPRMCSASPFTAPALSVTELARKGVRAYDLFRSVSICGRSGADRDHRAPARDLGLTGVEWCCREGSAHDPVVRPVAAAVFVPLAAHQVGVARVPAGGPRLAASSALRPTTFPSARAPFKSVGDPIGDGCLHFWPGFTDAQALGKPDHAPMTRYATWPQEVTRVHVANGWIRDVKSGYGIDPRVMGGTSRSPRSGAGAESDARPRSPCRAYPPESTHVDHPRRGPTLSQDHYFGRRRCA